MSITTFWKRWSSVWAALVAWAWTYAFFHEFILYPQWMGMPLGVMSVAGCFGATVLAIVTIFKWIEEEGSK